MVTPLDVFLWILGIVYAFAFIVFNIKIAKNFATAKNCNRDKAGLLAFLFGPIVWIYYWSIPECDIEYNESDNKEITKQ